MINDCCYGEDLCLWLIARLGEAGVECQSEPGQEDFGWYFNFSVDGAPHCLLAGLRQNSENLNSVDEDWVLIIERAAGFIASIFGGRDKNIMPAASLAVHAALCSAQPGEIENIRWHYKKDFDKNFEDKGTTTP